MTSVSIEVERPVAEAFSYATDPSKFSEWQQGGQRLHGERGRADGRRPLSHHPTNRRLPASSLRAAAARPRSESGCGWVRHGKDNGIRLPCRWTR